MIKHYGRNHAGAKVFAFFVYKGGSVAVAVKSRAEQALVFYDRFFKFGQILFLRLRFDSAEAGIMA